jgi:hypothetical protein
VVGDGRVSFRQLRVGHRAQGDKIVVLAGLSEGERVALDPLRAGRHIKEQALGALDE